MKKYLVYVKDQFDQFWTVVVDVKTKVSLTDAFEYATLKTFGGRAIGMKEIFTPTIDQNEKYKHGDVLIGMEGM